MTDLRLPGAALGSAGVDRMLSNPAGSSRGGPYRIGRAARMAAS